MQRRVVAVADLEAVSLAAVHEVCATIGRVLAQQERCSLVLAGGSSPRRLYELLAAPSFAVEIAWERVHVFWSDERCVKPEDIRSNYYLAKTCLLEHVPLPPANIHRMPGEIDSQQAVLHCEHDIRSFFSACADTPGTFPSFDIVLLGMGADGHVASLFPGDHEALQEDKHLVLATRAPEGSPAAQRLSMSLPLLCHSRDIFFIVYGSEKQPVRDMVLAGGPAAQCYPAARIRALGRLLWFIAP